MSLTAGSRLGPYEVVARLGAGGMGEVFRARDSRLGRDVAIKALPEVFAQDPERLARFEREARLLASLSHANIAGIHGLEEVDGRRYLVLEFVEGETLAARLARGPLPVVEALQMCAQIAGAVEAAHEAGVVHRDLKPGNVMLRPDGTAKVLDFGLAKSGVAVAGASSDQNLSASPTMTYGATSMGVILGTAAYMSPEQARGKPVDRRSDIWSLGCVLYECLTGRQCFAGETLSDTIAMILQRDPDWSILPSRTPLRVRQLLVRCLERDAKKRLRDAGEARIALESSLAGIESGTELSIETPIAGAGSRRTVAIAAAIGAVAGAALVLAAGRLAPGGARAPVVRSSVMLPEGRELHRHGFDDATVWDVSPDGARLIVRLEPRPGTVAPELYWRRLSDPEWHPVPGSERSLDFPVFDRDSRTVYFAAQISDESRDARVMRVNVEDGSAPVPLCDVPPEAVGSIPLAGGRVLFVHVDGRQIALREPGASGMPKWMPVDRGSFAGNVDANPMADCPALGRDQIFVGTTLYTRDGWHRGTGVLDLRTRKLTPLLQDGQWPALHPSGVLLYSRGTTLLARRFDLGARRVRGEEVPLMAGLRTRGQWLPARFRLTLRGDLVSSPGGATGEHRTLEWRDLRGVASPFSSELRSYARDPSLTPDGRRVVVTTTNARGFDEIWAFDGDQRLAQRALWADGSDFARPLVSRDGRWIAYIRFGVDGQVELAVAGFSGDTEPRVLIRRSSQDSVYRALDWFPDNRHLVVGLRLPSGDQRLVLMDAEAPPGQRTTPRVILPEHNVGVAAVSPNGQYLAFDSDRTGRNRIYVCGISPDGVSSAPVAVTRSGQFGAWINGGAGVLYADSTRVREVQISTAGGIAAGADRLAYDLGDEGQRVEGGTVAADGRLLLAMRPDETQNLSRLDVVQNWWASLKGRLPR